MSQYQAKAQAWNVSGWGIEVMCEPASAGTVLDLANDVLQRLSTTQGLQWVFYREPLDFFEAVEAVYRETLLFARYGDDPVRLTIPMKTGGVVLDVTDHG
jgi:hypothetical protein